MSALDKETLDTFGKVSAIGIAVITFVYGVLRVLARPFMDHSRFESWKRKATDAEKFMREGMFRDDFARSSEAMQLAERGVNLAAMNAQNIAALTAEAQLHSQAMGAQAALLHSIPHMAGTMEQMSSTLERAVDSIEEANRIGRNLGERVAANEAVLGMQPGDRPHFHRRRSDQKPGDTSGGGG